MIYATHTSLPNPMLSFNQSDIRYTVNLFGALPDPVYRLTTGIGHNIFFLRNAQNAITFHDYDTAQAILSHNKFFGDRARTNRSTFTALDSSAIGTTHDSTFLNRLDEAYAQDPLSTYLWEKEVKYHLRFTLDNSFNPLLLPRAILSGCILYSRAFNARQPDLVTLAKLLWAALEPNPTIALSLLSSCEIRAYPNEAEAIRRACQSRLLSPQDAAVAVEPPVQHSINEELAAFHEAQNWFALREYIETIPPEQHRNIITLSYAVSAYLEPFIKGERCFTDYYLRYWKTIAHELNKPHLCLVLDFFIERDSTQTISLFSRIPLDHWDEHACLSHIPDAVRKRKENAERYLRVKGPR